MIYDSDYEVRLATLQKLGGDITKNYDSVYEIDLAILDAIQGGGGGGAVIDDNDVSTGKTWSSSKIVSELASAGFDIEIVSELPTTGDPHTIYFIASSSQVTGNVYDEYMYINGNWEQVGSTSVDLSQYATKEWVNTSLGNYATSNDISTFITSNDVSIYAEKTYVDSSLDLKADKTELADYASKNALEEDEDVISNTVALLNKKVDDNNVELNNKIYNNTELINDKANKSDITVLKNYADNIYAKSSKDLDKSDNITAAGIYYSVKSYDDSIKNVISISQAAYDALQDKDAKTVYIIIPE